jgi:ABC-type transport system involved in multi-copper enzyme maturation permease subunit
LKQTSAATDNPKKEGLKDKLLYILLIVVLFFKQILAIAGNTIKEGLRNKLFYILLGVALLFLLLARGCMSGNMQIQSRQLSADEVAAFGTVLGFHVIIFWGLTLAGLLSMGALLGDIETGVITVFISKPISRFQYLVGKFIGVSAVVLLNMVILGAGFFLLAFLKAGSWPFELFIALGVFTLNIFMLISFIFLVSLATARIIAMVFGIVAYIFSIGIDIPFYFDAIRNNLEAGSPAMLIIMKILYFAFPQFGSTQFYAASFVGELFGNSVMSFWPAVHTLVYTVLFWLLMVLFFGRKEF